jgi:hypothetical protein
MPKPGGGWIVPANGLEDRAPNADPRSPRVAIDVITIEEELRFEVLPFGIVWNVASRLVVQCGLGLVDPYHARFAILIRPVPVVKRAARKTPALGGNVDVGKEAGPPFRGEAFLKSDFIAPRRAARIEAYLFTEAFVDLSFFSSVTSVL